MNLLIQHLLDTAAVAELLWDSYLAPPIKRAIDEACGGAGRVLFAFLCGVHDVGKASPAFQAKVAVLVEAVALAGLRWNTLDKNSQRWHHTQAGAVIMRRVLANAGWDQRTINWIWPLIIGHHGRVSRLVNSNKIPGRGNAQGRGPEWLAAQDALVYRVATDLDIDLAALVLPGRPSRAIQLALSGAIIMADWIASDEKQFSGIDQLGGVSISAARDRAAKAIRALGLRGGWRLTSHDQPDDLVKARFGWPARGVQLAAIELAEWMPAPGLLIIEAPMGEGKTEAALAAVEVLSRRFGADGVFVGMPTQATSDPMFSRVEEWARLFAPQVPIALLHGKRHFNRRWRELEETIQVQGVDPYGCDDGDGAFAGSEETTSDSLVQWFLGCKRGLLSPITIGTIDQLLHAATRTKHVMLRHTGLAGRVVVLDEVHAYDVYMAEFLFEALRWLADAGVPVVVLSATLPPNVRTKLVTAYAQGATKIRDVDVSHLPDNDAYPSAVAATVVDGTVRFDTRGSSTWRPSQSVAIEVLDEPGPGEPSVADVLAAALGNGGCALVVRNTVRRAQNTYRALRAEFGADVVLRCTPV